MGVFKNKSKLDIILYLMRSNDNEYFDQVKS